MDMEQVVLWSIVGLGVFFVIGLIFLRVFKIVFTIATGICVVLLVLFTPVLVVFLGASGLRRLFARVWSFKDRSGVISKKSAALRAHLGAKGE